MGVLKAHDGSPGTVMAMVCLKHLRSLDNLLNQRLKDPFENIRATPRPRNTTTLNS